LIVNFRINMLSAPSAWSSRIWLGDVQGAIGLLVAGGVIAAAQR
jgi:hypothetical protein